MGNFNTKYILPGDDKNQIIRKINYNFQQVFFNGVGEDGEIGNIGATGIRGQVGRDGDIGATGSDAVKWFFTVNEPDSSVSSDGDLWVNKGPTGSQEVYEYNGTSWVDTGETLLSSGVFDSLSSVEGPGSASDGVAIGFSTNPSSSSLVISDVTGSTADVNPNFSKLLLGTDASSDVTRPIVAFGKSFQSQSDLPGFYWENADGEYDFVFQNPDSNQTVQSGGSLVLSATGGTAYVSSSQILNISSNTTIDITGSTGGTGTYSISTPTTISASSSNLSITPSLFSATYSATGGVTTSGSEPIVMSGLNGVILSSSSTSQTEYLYLAKNPTGSRIFGVTTNGDSRLGATGASGARIVKGVTSVNYTLGPTFVNSPYTNYYVTASPSNDICIITPQYVSGSISADGRSNRVYLLLNNFSNWVDSEVRTPGGFLTRTFDFFLDSTTYCFAGIRTIPSGGSPNNYPISDTGSTPSTGCRHIRITFVGDFNKFQYKAFVKGSAACGWGTFSDELQGSAGGVR